jgi:retrograde regulation protein 2
LPTALGEGVPQTDASSYPTCFTDEILNSAINLMNHHGSIPKEGRAAAGLHCTTTGILASAHGVSHENRALLSLILSARWGDEVADSSFYMRLQQLIGPEKAWWCKYLGRCLAVIGAVYPAGVVPHLKEKVALNSKVKAGLGKRGTDIGIRLKIHTREGDPGTQALMVRKEMEGIEKCGKKKAWVKGWGLRVDVSHRTDLWENEGGILFRNPSVSS